MSEYYGTPAASSDFLAHYGVKGMKWGVRKFAKDLSANPSSKFKAMYGSKASKNASPHKMQKHYNALDQSRANINQRMRGDWTSFLTESISYNEAMKRDPKYWSSEKQKNKHAQYLKKQIDSFSTRKKQLENLTRMQNDIAKAAIRNGYSASYTPTVRSGVVGIPTKMNGTKAKITKTKPGKKQTTVMNIYNIKKDKWHI